MPPVPTPAKKTTTSASANALIDRLSKPTAASASKARSPPVTPSKTAKQSPARTTTSAPTRGTTLKPRVEHAPARIKQEKEKEANAREDTQKTNGTTSAIPDVVALDTATEEDLESRMVLSVSPSLIVDDEPEHEKEDVVESYDDDFMDDTIIHDDPPTIAHEVSATEEPALFSVVESEHIVDVPFKEDDIVVPPAEKKWTCYSSNGRR